ncbi:MAG: hypothetical protein HQM09_11055 [Candidatus Riflebacteria bacterium]|nr:hypothetical protein [Candidatus Riflebacteria bacterium]
MKRTLGILVLCAFLPMTGIAFGEDQPQGQGQGQGLGQRQGGQGQRPAGDGFGQQEAAKLQAHFATQKQENQTFFQGLSKDLKPEEKRAQIKAHFETQYTENVAFFDSLNQETLAHIKERMGQNPNIPEDKKNEVYSFLEQQFNDGKAFREKQHQEREAFFGSNTVGDKNNAATGGFQQLLQSQMQEARKFHMGQAAARGAKMQEIYQAIKAQRGNGQGQGRGPGKGLGKGQGQTVNN